MEQSVEVPWYTEISENFILFETIVDNKLTHFDEEGRSRMVDVTEKPITRREAFAGGRITMLPETFERIVNKQVQKGDVLEVARLAAIMGAKRTGDTIPLCHPISLNQVEVLFDLDREANCVNITAKVKCEGRTGVEMEAMHAVAVAGLTIYDMCKAVDREMVISEIRLIKKSGGKSGTFERSESAVER